MKGILGLIILVLWIVAIVDLFKNVKDKNKKILWLILIIILPAVGAVLYFLIGKKK